MARSAVLVFAVGWLLATGCAEHLGWQRTTGSEGWSTGYLFWPPPPATSVWQSDASLAGRSFGEVAEGLANLLESAGYTQSSTGRIGAQYEQGFVVTTRPERIHGDARPWAASDRWAAFFPEPASLKWLTEARTFQGPHDGRYRALLFAATNLERQGRGTRPTPWNEQTVMAGRDLPAVRFPDDRRFSAGSTLSVYIYEYAVTDGTGAFIEAGDAEHSAMTHVLGAGLGPLGRPFPP